MEAHATDEDLCRRWQAGDQRAGDALAQRLSGLVTALARKFWSPMMTMDDKVSLGNLALARAMNGFDPAYGRFRPYASTCIWNALARSNGDRRDGPSVKSELENWITCADGYEEMVGGCDSHAAFELDQWLQDNCTELEDIVFGMWLYGYTYNEIVAETARCLVGRRSVEVCSALHRIKQRALRSESFPLDVSSNLARTRASMERGSTQPKPLWSTANDRHRFAERCAMGHHGAGRPQPAHQLPVVVMSGVPERASNRRRDRLDD